ncbi:immunoglobulin iota chain-like protein [Cricetulus griseus]|nr:immunoglobulin iota chain-like protein [Cricetulus griseus]
MAWTSLLITLLAHCTGAISQFAVIQESSLTTTPGGTVTLTCGSSTGAVTTNNYANWVQEKSQEVHTGLIGGTSNRVPGVHARFSGSLLGDKAALTITGAQPEDEAVYYCALWHSDHFHNGTCRCGRQVLTSGNLTDMGPDKSLAMNNETAQTEDSGLKRSCAVPTMGWTPGIFLILSYLTGSFSQSILTQPPSISESLGSTARLTCTLRSGISVGGKNIYWYQQMEGSAPRLFLYYYSDSDKKLGPGVPNRVSGSKDTSKNTANLQISELQVEDEAVYYCFISESSAYHSDTGRWGSRHKL